MAFPGTYNFNYYKGDTFEFSIYPKNTDGTPFDLTGFDSQFVVSTQRGAAGADNRVESYSEIDGDHINCVVLPSDSDAWESASQYVYDVEVYNEDNELYPLVYTLLTGTITVTDQVGVAVLGAS